MGLPGAGKTTLAEAIRERLWQEGRTVSWFNADQVRRDNNDWDFTNEGRIRQATRMRIMADAATTDYVVCDFVAPLVEMRDVFNADWTIWVDTIVEGRYEDTNKSFIKPKTYNFRITEQDASKWSEFVVSYIVNSK